MSRTCHEIEKWWPFNHNHYLIIHSILFNALNLKPFHSSIWVREHVFFGWQIFVAEAEPACVPEMLFFLSSINSRLHRTACILDKNSNMVNRMYNQWIIPNHTERNTEPESYPVQPISPFGGGRHAWAEPGVAIWAVAWLRGPWQFGHWLTTTWGCEASVCKMRCSRMETLASLGDAIGLWDNMGPDGTRWDNMGAMVFWCILYRLCPSWLWYTYQVLLLKLQYRIPWLQLPWQKRPLSDPW